LKLTFLQRRYGKEVFVARQRSLAPLSKEAGERQREKVLRRKNAQNGTYVKRTEGKDAKGRDGKQKS
jgi:hypothetical protein